MFKNTFGKHPTVQEQTTLELISKEYPNLDELRKFQININLLFKEILPKLILGLVDLFRN